MFCINTDILTCTSRNLLKILMYICWKEYGYVYSSRNECMYNYMNFICNRGKDQMCTDFEREKKKHFWRENLAENPAGLCYGPLFILFSFPSSFSLNCVSDVPFHNMVW